MEQLNLNIISSMNIRVTKDDVNEVHRRLSLGESTISHRVFTKLIKNNQQVR